MGAETLESTLVKSDCYTHTHAYTLMGSHCVHCMTEPPGTRTRAIAQISASVTADAGDGSPPDDDTQ